jgi:hypothetical protein
VISVRSGGRNADDDVADSCLVGNLGLPRPCNLDFKECRRVESKLNVIAAEHPDYGQAVSRAPSEHAAIM